MWTASLEGVGSFCSLTCKWTGYGGPSDLGVGVTYLDSCTEGPHRNQFIYLPQGRCRFTASEVQRRGDVCGYLGSPWKLHPPAFLLGCPEKDLRRLSLSLCSRPGPWVPDLQDPARSRLKRYRLRIVSGGCPFREGGSALRGPGPPFLCPSLVFRGPFSSLESELGS